MNIGFCIPIVGLVIYITTDLILKRREYQAKELCQKLEIAWRNARNNRVTWEHEHFNTTISLPKSSREYKELWQAEIEAESLYLHKAPEGTVTTSWLEFHQRQEEEQTRRKT